MGLPLALKSAIQWKKRSSKAKRKGRGRKRRREDDLVAPEIPLDLQMEILARLPAKSLMRFKCVSKLWSCLIRCRYFSNRYLKVPRPARLYMSLVEHIECDSMELWHKPRESALLSSSSSSSNSAESLDTMPGMGGRNMVVLRGLMLYIVCGKACIHNPTTRQSVTLPAVKSNIFAKKGFPRRRVLYFLGYDPVLDQYKVVCTVVIYSKKFLRMTSEHWVFVLEAGGSWKRIEIDLPPHFPVRLGLCINGVIYYLASTCNSRDIVVSFDVRSEEFTNVQTPPHVVPAYRKLVGFIEYGGKPAIFDHTNLVENGLVDLWVLEDAGKWSRTSLVLQPCQLHLLDNDHDIHFLTVEGTTQNGEVILAVRPLLSPCYILYYHLHNNDLRKVRIRGIPDHWFRKPDTNLYFYFKLMDKIESIMHLET